MKLAPLTTLERPKPEPANAAEQRKLAEATRSFEAVLIRQMLTSLEKTTQMAGSKGALGGGSAYSSMMVDSLADAIARSGGLGLAKTLEPMLESKLETENAAAPPVEHKIKPLK